MGWTYVPDVDTSSSSANDNPFAAPRQQPLGRINVKLPTDGHLARGISIKSFRGWWPSERRVCQGQSFTKQVVLFTSKFREVGWLCQLVCLTGVSESTKLNSSYSVIARSSSLATPAPASRSINQDILRRWKKSACE